MKTKARQPKSTIAYVEDQHIFRWMIQENIAGTELTENSISPVLDDFKRLPEVLRNALGVLIKIPDRIKGIHIQQYLLKTIVDELEKALIKDTLISKNKKHNKTIKKYEVIKINRCKKTETYHLIKHLIGSFNLLQYKIKQSKNPEGAAIFLQISAIFDSLTNRLADINLDGTLLYEMALSFVVKSQYEAIDVLTLQAEELNLIYKPSEGAKHRRQIALALLQNLEILSGSSSKESNELRQSIYKVGSTYALVEAEISLGLRRLASRRLDHIYMSIKHSKMINICLIDRIFGYILSLDKVDDMNLRAQEIVLWSNRAIDLLNKDIISNDKEIKQSDLECIKMLASEKIQQYKPVYYAYLKGRIKELAPKGYLIQSDKVSISLSSNPSITKKLTQILYHQLSDTDVKWKFQGGKLLLLNIFDMPGVRVAKLIDRQIRAIVEKTKSLVAKLKAKRDKEQALQQQQAIEANMKMLEVSKDVPMQREALKTVSSPLNQSSKSKLEPEIKVSKVKEKPLQVDLLIKPFEDMALEPANRLSKVRKKKESKFFLQGNEHEHSNVRELPEQKQKKWYSASNLKLKSEQLLKSGVKFIKLNGALKTYVGFMDTFKSGKGKVPTQEILERFRKTICDVPCKVGPRNQNGFKYMALPKSPTPVIVGKIKCEPWRLLPICQEVTAQGATVILYGKLKNTKKGKKKSRYKS